VAGPLPLEANRGAAECRNQQSNQILGRYRHDS
jgi:hypothetical protein